MQGYAMAAQGQGDGRTLQDFRKRCILPKNIRSIPKFYCELAFVVNWNLEGDDIITVFLAEGREHLSHIAILLTSLAGSSQALGVIDQIFRRIHTIKGGAAAAEFMEVCDLAHELESMLVGVRQRGAFANGAQQALFRAGLLKIEALLAQKAALLQAKDGGRANEGAASFALSDAMAPLAYGGGAAGSFLDSSPSLAHLRIRREDFAYLQELWTELDQVLASDSAPSRRARELMAKIQSHLRICRSESFGSLFAWLRGVIQRCSRQLGKQVALDTVGDDIRADYRLLEALASPLTHLLINCCDHGIESARQRKAAGKAKEGRIRIEVRVVPGSYILEVTDDGRGIDLQAIARKAVKAGLLSRAGARGATEGELMALIFKPGFSMAKKLTQTSGRGYGLDIVKASVEKLGGRVSAATRHGSGASFTLIVPAEEPTATP